MNRFTRPTITTFLCMAIPAAAFGAEPFPAARDQPAGCSDIDWPEVLVNDYPDVIDACQEVVSSKDGSTWARFDGEFVRLDRDGKLTFTILGSNKRRIDEVSVIPGKSQVAYISGRETQFKDLRRGQKVNLYLPDGSSGFTTQLDAPVATVATIESKQDLTDSTVADAKPAGTPEYVQFSLGSAVLTPEAKQMLDSKARMLKDNPAAEVSLSGHTSASASEAFNQTLSEKRAEAVRDYLVNSGRIENNRVTAVGYGEMRPLEHESDPLKVNSGQARANMRVEVLITTS